MAEVLLPVFLIMAAILGISSYKYFGMKEDNPIEQAAEKIIKEDTGIEIDLSPNSPEEKK